MKKKFTKLFAAGGVAILMLTGCSGDIDASSKNGTELYTVNAKEFSCKTEENTMETSELEEASQPTSETEEEFDTATLFTGWLPENVNKVMAETAPNEAVKKAIIDYYEIPAEYWKETKYYYNYVDLNENGINEVFVVVMGSYVGGSGGDSALWLAEDMSVNQAFTLVHTPIILVEDNLNEYKRLIMQRSGGGAESEVISLTCENGVYTNVADADVLEDIQNIKGTAIISNDLIQDTEEQKYLTLEN